MGLPPPPADRLFAVLADGSDALTWGDMVIKRNRIACALSKHLPDSIIAGAIYSKNSVQWALCHQVCTVMGLRFSPINWHLVGDEVAYIVDNCDADVVFFGKDFVNIVSDVRSRTPKVKAWVCMDGAAKDAFALDDLVNEAPLDAAPPSHKRSGGMISYTGGTTGKPKGAVRDSAGQADAKDRMKMLGEWGFMRMMPHPIQLVAAPLYHAMPMAWYSVGVALGCTFVFMPKFDIAVTLAAIDKYKINGFYMPPILLKRLLQTTPEQRSKVNLSSVRTVMSGGAACPFIVKQGISDMFGPVLHEIYGASEMGGVAVMGPENMLKKPLSCGRPAAGFEIIILDENKQKVTKPGVAGDIYAKGMNIQAYHKLDEKTDEAKFGDFFSVGDIGYFDEDGYLYISDRKIDMIVSGGVNIYPAQVETIFQNYPDIEDVAVFGLPDEEYGERVHAAVKLAPGRQATAKKMLEWCEGKIGKFQLPREADISFHSEDFPRTEAGKLRKKVLRQSILDKQSPPPQSKL